MSIELEKYRITPEQIKSDEDMIDSYSLSVDVRYKNKIIHTFGELKKIAKSIEIIELLEDQLDEEAYCYIYNWRLMCNFKENK
jgi:hypothetical protein